jgi:RNA recognition motif-containing protein
MKLHIGNLPFSVGEDELKNLLSDYNPDEVTLIKDKFSGRSKGFGFANIPDEEAAQKAISELNGKDMGGRELKVSEARPMEERPERPRRSFGGDRGGDRGGFGGGNRGGGSFNRGPRRY